MAKNVSKTLGVSKIAMLFLTLFVGGGCSLFLETNRDEKSQLESVQKPQDPDDQTRVQVPIYHVTEGEYGFKLNQVKVQVDGSELKDQVAQVLDYFFQADPTGDDAVQSFYQPLNSCQVLFMREGALYMTCTGLSSARVGLRQETKLLFGLLQTLFSFESIVSVTLMHEGAQAEVFMHQLILPDHMNHDFMDKLRSILESAST